MTIKTNQVLDFDLFLDGKWQTANSKETFDVMNPANGEVVAHAAKAGVKDVELAVESARKSFDSGIWLNKTPQERAEILLQFSKKMIENVEELAYLEAVCSGTIVRRSGSIPIRNAETLKRTAQLSLEYSYKHSFQGTPENLNQVVREPIGVVAAITPWNAPMNLAMFKLAPALAMGNSIVMKPASYTPLSTLKLAELAVEAGLPPGVFNVITGPGASVGEALVTHPSVDKVSFTGSTEVGRRIMELSSRTVKRLTMELGGKSPAIVLPDADLDLAIPGIIFGFCLHAGQLCESGTRLLVHDSIYDEVVERLVKAVSTIKIGDPFEQSTGMGPLISKSQLDSVLSYIEAGVNEGARLVYGGEQFKEKPLDKGYFIKPTIFAEVNNNMKIAREEIFGPVLTVIRYHSEEDAIKIANDSIYGLAAGIWTKDINKAEQISKKLKAGTVWINDWHMTNNDAPFGGYKQSGFGRELGSYALDEYTQLKHIHRSLQNDPSKRSAFYSLY